MVKTNDPDKNQFFLTVTGKVSLVAKITPATLSLSGKPGDTLEGVVSITPAQDYPFSITSLTQKFSSQIKAELIRPADGSGDWKVRVTAVSKKADDLYDIITLKTDSRFKPVLKIRVYAIYFDSQVNQS
jgi:hypothetical protein